MEKVIAFIPALVDSAGSSPDFNQLFCGRPLIYWTLEALQRSDAVRQIVIATNNEEPVIDLANFHFSKIKWYRTDKAELTAYERVESLLLEYVRREKPAHQDVLLLTDYHFPLTDAVHFDRACDLLKQQHAHSVFAAIPNRHFFWTPDGVSINYNYRKRPADAEPKKELLETGALYGIKVGTFIANVNRLSGKIAVCELPTYTALQLREPVDWLVGERLMHQYRIDHRKASGIGRVKLLVSDVDGVLTDGSMYYTENGDEIKRFHTYDGMAFVLLREKGIRTALITSEDTQMVANRAKKLKIDYLYQGRRHGGKLAAIREICEEMNIGLEDVLYIGDDINCREALQAVGFAFCPANALPDIRELPNVIHLETKGGSGAVREVYEKYLRPGLER